MSNTMKAVVALSSVMTMNGGTAFKVTLPISGHGCLNLALGFVASTMVLTACDNNGQAASTPATQPSAGADAPTVPGLLKRWDSTRSPVPPSDPVFMHAQKILNSAKANNNCADYVWAAQMFMAVGDLSSAKAALDAALSSFPDQDGPHLCLAELYYRLAFHDIIERRLYDMRAVPVDEAQISELRSGHLRVEISELLSSGRPRGYNTLVRRFGITSKEKAQILLYVSSLCKEKLSREAEASVTRHIREVGTPTSLPIVSWKPDLHTLTILRWARSEIDWAKRATRMNEPPGVVIIDREDVERLSDWINHLLAIDTKTKRKPQPGLPETRPTSVLRVPPIVEEVLRNYNPKVSPITGKPVEDWEKSLKLDPANMRDQLTVGYLYHTETLYKRAIQHYIKAANMDPDVGDPLIGLAQIYHRLANFERMQTQLSPESKRAAATGLTETEEREKDLLVETKNLLERVKALLSQGKSVTWFAPYDVGKTLEEIDLRLLELDKM